MDLLSDNTDEQLLDMIKEKNHIAMRVFVFRHWDSHFSFLKQHLSADDQTTADLVSEICCFLWENHDLIVDISDYLQKARMFICLSCQRMKETNNIEYLESEDYKRVSTSFRSNFKIMLKRKSDLL